MPLFDTSRFNFSQPIKRFGSLTAVSQAQAKFITVRQWVKYDLASYLYKKVNTLLVSLHMNLGLKNGPSLNPVIDGIDILFDACKCCWLWHCLGNAGKDR